jgi:putative ABC transport system permease protein
MSIRHRLDSWFPWRWRRAREAELERELRDHLDLEAEEQQAAGLSSEEAAYAAKRALGNTALIKEDVRAAWGFQWLETFSQDIRYGLRQLRRNPGFTIVAVLTLALGIGANTAIFSLLDAVVLHALPYPHPGELVAIYQRGNQAAGGNVRTGLSAPNVDDLGKGNNVFQGVACYRWERPFLTGANSAQYLLGAAISANLLKLLGAQPFLGRGFTPQELEPGHDQVALLGYGVWEQQFGGKRGMIGQTIQLDGKPYTVVGVMPKSFYFVMDDEVGVLTPLPFGPKDSAEAQRSKPTVNALARLKPGVSLTEAQAELDTIADRLAKEYPDTDRGLGLEVRSLLSTYFSPSVPDALTAITAAIFFVLLIACVNVANMLLAHSMARRKEFAVRAALGAGRKRLLGQLVTESLLLGLAGGSAGILVAWAGVRLFVLGAHSYPLAGSQWIGLNGSTFAFCLILCLVTVTIFGLMPSLHASKVDVNQSLKEAGTPAASGSSGQRLRSGLVIAEVTLAMILMTGAGLLMRTFANDLRANLGFDPKHVLEFQVALPPYKYKTGAQQAEFFEEAVGHLGALPGVVSASGYIPGDRLEFRPEGVAPRAPGMTPSASTYAVLPGLIHTIRASLIAGRGFTQADAAGSPRVTIINETLARLYFRNVNPVGRHLVPLSRTHGNSNTPSRPLDIVGVVKDIEFLGLRDNGPRLYLPYAQYQTQHGMIFLLRTGVSPLSLVPSVRADVRSIDGDAAVGWFETLEESVAAWQMVRLPAAVVGIFAGIALILSAVGMSGVVSYTVTQRTQEIGIRMALGAQKGDVLKLVVAQGLKLALIGVTIGIVGALALTRFLSSLLYGVKPTDPLTFITVSLILLAVALLACYIPARRASKVDPMVALRYE